MVPFTIASRILIATIFSVNLAQTVFCLPSIIDWQELAVSVDGRLKRALPVAAPCFSIVNGENNTVDEAACDQVKAGYGTPNFRSPRYPAFMLNQWERCQRRDEHCLLDESNTSNPAAWTNSSCQQGSVSEYYIEILGSEDVQKAFAFASKTGVPLSIKASGHDFKGRSSLKDSLALWTRQLTNITYTPNFVPDGSSQSYERTITFGAGVPFEDLYTFADSHNVTVIGGYHHTVTPSGGWVQGGGHSILSPVYGLGVDRVIQFKVVTPDGKFRVVNSAQNADLFWALRGGGGSTFGVVLESTFRVEPQMKLQVVSLSYTRNSTNFQPFLKLIVDQSSKWATEGWGGHIKSSDIINVTPLLTLDEAKASLKPITDYVNTLPGASVVIEELPSWLAFFDKYVTVAEAPVGTEYTLGTRLISAELFNSEESRHSLTDLLVRMVEETDVDPNIILGTPFLYKETSPDETSVTPAWRNSLWHLGGVSRWKWNSTVSVIREKYNIASQVAQWMRDITPGSGAYLNEADLYEPVHEESFWGPNYAALLEIKRKYDPFSLLDCWQCVGWSGTEDNRFNCYL